MTGQLTLDLEPRTWGGKREGAGRKRDRSRSDPSHAKQAIHRERHPLHLVMRAFDDVPRLRSEVMLSTIREATWSVDQPSTFRLLQMSVQHNHLHLIAEAEDNAARSEAMHRLGLALARGINGSTGRKGKVFRYRYHATEITSPTQMHHAYAYVLCNWRHHGEHLRSDAARKAMFDPYSTASRFDGWSIPTPPTAFDPNLPVYEPQTWIARTGWRLLGKIDPRHIPGTRP
jgi:REP element-mobilizing transposase RayT